MCKFKPGDRVRKKNGLLFSSTWETVTVHQVVEVSSIFTQVWFKETTSWMEPRDLELVESGSLKGFAKFIRKLDTA